MCWSRSEGCPRLQIGDRLPPKTTFHKHRDDSAQTVTILEVDGMLSQLSCAQDPFHLLTRIKEVSKLHCAMLTKSDLFAEAFDTPVCYDPPNLRVTISILDAVAQEHHQGKVFINASHRIIPCLADPDLVQAATRVIVRAEKTVTALADELVFESRLVHEMADIVLRPDIVISHRMCLARILKATLTRASPARVSAVSGPLGFLCHALFFTTDVDVADIAAKCLTIAIRRIGLPARSLVAPDIIERIITCPIVVPESFVGMIDATAAQDPDLVADGNFTDHLITWLFKCLQQDSLETQAISALSKCALSEAVSRRLIDSGIAVQIIGAHAGFPFHAKHDFFVMLCGVAMVDPKMAGDASMLAELFDVLLGANSTVLFRISMSAIEKLAVSGFEDLLSEANVYDVLESLSTHEGEEGSLSGLLLSKLRSL